MEKRTWILAMVSSSILTANQLLTYGDYPFLQPTSSPSDPNGIWTRCYHRERVVSLTARPWGHLKCKDNCQPCLLDASRRQYSLPFSLRQHGFDLIRWLLGYFLYAKHLRSSITYSLTAELLHLTSTATHTKVIPEYRQHSHISFKSIDLSCMIAISGLLPVTIIW